MTDQDNDSSAHYPCEQAPCQCLPTPTSLKYPQRYSVSPHPEPVPARIISPLTRTMSNRSRNVSFPTRTDRSQNHVTAHANHITIVPETLHLKQNGIQPEPRHLSCEPSQNRSRNVSFRLKLDPARTVTPLTRTKPSSLPKGFFPKEN